MSIERRTVGVMFTASAFSVANIYYCQPLLSDIGRSLGVSDSAIGYLAHVDAGRRGARHVRIRPAGRHVPAAAIEVVIMSGATAATASMMALAPKSYAGQRGWIRARAHRYRIASHPAFRRETRPGSQARARRRNHSQRAPARHSSRPNGERLRGRSVWLARHVLDCRGEHVHAGGHIAVWPAL